MEVAIGFTLYLTFGLWLILPTLGAPEIFARLCIGLCEEEGPTVEGLLAKAAARGFTVSLRTV